jgi:hypothetical protein
MALCSAGLAETLSVEAPTRTLMLGHSKSTGRSLAADAWLSPVVDFEPKMDENDGVENDGNEGADEQPAKATINGASAASLRRRNLDRNATNPPILNALVHID